jgi:cysteinyl-tRNA synthetase
MRVRLYDSLTQAKRDFVPRDGDHVTMYFCGPTVYNYIHLGNARPYVVSMVTKRYFESHGWSVTLVENITDIDDRIILKAQDEGRSWDEVARRFAEAYLEDTDRLGLGRPDVEPFATEHIPEIVALIEELIANGHAYQADGDVYFDVDSFAEYGKLSKQQITEMRHGARIQPGEVKNDPLDFALWKGAKEGEPAWDRDRPGRWSTHRRVRALLGPQRHVEHPGREDVQEHRQHLPPSRGAPGVPPGGPDRLFRRQPLPQSPGVQPRPA